MKALWSWKSWAVTRRHAFVYLRNWKTAFIPPAMEPVVFFLAFGLGLAGYVETLSWEGKPIAYGNYVAGGIIAYTGFGTAFYEALYGAYVRMFYQKTWDGILGTQVELEHIVWAEILWAGLRATMNGIVVCAVLAVFHLLGLIDIHLNMLVVMPLLTFVSGCAFAAFGMIFTAIVPAIDHMNYPVFLIGIPLSLLSNTYFPVHSDIFLVQLLIELNPIYHFAESARTLILLGQFDWYVPKLLLSSIGLLLLSTFAAQRLIYRRVLSSS